MDAGVGLVDLVDEQDAGNFPVFQFAQDELKLRDFLLVQFAHDHRRVDRRQRRAHVVNEFDRAGAVEEGIGVAHEIGGGDRQLDAHFVMARFFAGVADRIAGLDVALARDHAGAGEDRLKQRGLAALERTDQRDAAWTRRSRAVAVCCHAISCHDRLPRRPAVRARAACNYRFRRGGCGSRAVTSRLTAWAANYCARCNSSEPMPAAALRPTWPCTDSGCNATERFDPPISALAPTPAPTVASAWAPV